MSCLNAFFIKVTSAPLAPIIIDLNDVSYATYGTRKNDAGADEKLVYVYFKSGRYILLAGNYADDFCFKTKSYIH